MELTFKDFLFLTSGGHLVYRSGTILVGSHLGNIPMKFESHGPEGSGDDGRRTMHDGH